MPQFIFPQDFLWGAATSSHQVEGNNTLNDWWEWEQQGKVKEKSLSACNQWELYEKDFDLAKSLSHNAHRFSIEWSRIEPREGEFNPEAVGHYRQVLLALRARGIEAVVTLHHFTNPLWFTRKGGWERAEAIDEFMEYARHVVRELSSLVRYWITFNEPMVFVYKGYVEGEWPPGKQSVAAAIRVTRYLAYAHAKTYRVIHEEAKKQKIEVKISIAQHMIIFSPCNPRSWTDRLSTGIRFWFFNFVLLEAFKHGWLFFPGIFWEKLPFRGTLDYIGLNYYTRDYVQFIGVGIPEIFGNVCTRGHHLRDGAVRNTLQWEIYPEGLYELLRQLKRYRLPILITENGVCTDDDSQRETFIGGHLRNVGRALQEGIPVIGYLYWSLLDNFEWAEGYTPRFGLIEVNYETQQRTVRPSALKMAELIRTGKM